MSTSTLDASSFDLDHRRCRAAFERGAAGVGINDLDGNCVDANPALCAILGHDRSSILGRRPEDFIVEYSGVVSVQMAQMLRGAYDHVSGEASIRRGDGSLAWVLVSVALIRDSVGVPDFFFMQLQDISDRVAADQVLASTDQRLRQALHGVVGSVAAAVDARDPYTAGHQRRVAAISTAISAELGLDADATLGIGLAASIHDIGKIAVPAEILGKPGRLASAEYELIKLHPQTGHDIVAAVDFPWPIARMILEHHERIDGSGYPAGHKGNDILLGSRVIAVADVLEAMSSHRPYRAALGVEIAVATIQDGRGTLFDADVVDACGRCIERWDDQLPSVPAAT